MGTAGLLSKCPVIYVLVTRRRNLTIISIHNSEKAERSP